MIGKSLLGKRVLVTGATGGIGLEISKLFAYHGAIVGMHYKSNEKGCYFVPQRGLALRSDFTVSNSAIDLLFEYLKLYNGIDILINNAGLAGSDVSYDDIFTVNTKVPFLLMHNVFPIMRKQKWGRIINISSIAAKYGSNDNPVYAASKAALENFTTTFSCIGAEDNVLVNTVRLGAVDTDFHSKIGRSKESIDDRAKNIPLKRFGLPEEAANMVIYLASSAGDWITGQTFIVSGGD